MTIVNSIQGKDIVKYKLEKWNIVSFSKTVKDYSSGNTKLNSNEYLTKGEVSIVDQGKKLIAGFHNDSSLTVKTSPPYIIFGDHTRIFKYVDFPFIMGADGIKVLKPISSNLYTKFLYYFFNSVNIPNTGYNRHFKYLKELKIPLPPLEEQKRIAAILDAADQHRQKTKELIAKYDELSQSLFLDMFGDPVTNPKGWDSENIGEMLNFLTSGSRGWAKYYSNSGSIFLRIQNVGYNKLKLEDITYVDAHVSAESKRTLVQEGDVLLTITADLGRTAVIPFGFPKAYINQHLAILRLKEEYNPEYVSAYIASKGGQSLFLKLDKGGVKAGLNFSDIKSYKVLIPPYALQTQFTLQMQEIEKQKAQVEESLKKAEDLFQSLLQKAFKGELT